MIKTKGFRLTIYILLATMLISCFFVLCITLTKDKTYPKPETPKAADLVIYDLEDLNNFATEVRTGNHYTGQTVVLNADINCNYNGLNPIGTYTPNDEQYFEGTFDGQGHTISNIYFGWSNGVEYWNGFDCGLFNINKGTIKNTRFATYSVYIKVGTYWGFVVGRNYGTIENCIVENVKYISNQYRTDTFVAPIAGYNLGTVKNCLTKGYYRIGGNDGNGAFNADGLNAYYFVAGGNAATNCIFTSSVETVTNDNNDGTLCYPPSQTKDPDHRVSNEMSNNYSSCLSAYSSMTSDISTLGGTSGTAWFKYNSSSKGYGQSSTYCVYLRNFIGWSTCTFSAGTGGSVSPTSVQVPSDYPTDITTSDNKAYAHGTAVTATPNTGYQFSYWSGSGSSRKANFTLKPVYLKFSNGNTSIIQITSDINIALDTEYAIQYSGKLSITCTKNTLDRANAYFSDAGRYLDCWCLSSITFSFKDYNNGVTRKITYQIKDSKYFIGYVGSNFPINTSTSVTGNSWFTIYAFLKSYNITLG